MMINVTGMLLVITVNLFDLCSEKLRRLKEMAEKTYEQLCDERYCEIPFDLEGNRNGFPYRNYGSDISAHLPMLQFIASQCNHVTELGVRNGYSTVALFNGCNKVVSYDIEKTAFVEQLRKFKPYWKFIQGDTSDPRIEKEHTDFLFVDTLHTYDHVKAELKNFHPYVKKFIAFHDTYSQGEKSLDVSGAEGINKAIREFLEENEEWKSVYKCNFNNGLWIIQRMSDYKWLKVKKLVDVSDPFDGLVDRLETIRKTYGSKPEKNMLGRIWETVRKFFTVQWPNQNGD